MKYLKLFLPSRRLSGAESTVGAYSRLVGAGRMGLRSYSVDDVKLGNSDAVVLAPNIRQQAESGGSQNAAFVPEMGVRLASDPGAGELLNQPDFVKMVQDIEKNPNTLKLYLKDERVLQALGDLLNLKFQGRDVETASGGSPERKMPEEAENVTAENYPEMGKYEDCIKDCDIAVERGRELRTDFKLVARALTRKGTALVKMAKCSKDYEPAIETFYKALTEHHNPYTLKKLNDAEKAKKDLEQHEYFDPKLADEEHEKGNQFFKEQKYPEAIKHYTKALKRNPKDPKAYSNRAASYTKLGDMPEKCIELDPTFAKGYTRKGAIQFFMKEFDEALKTYQEGLKHDPSNQELLDGIRRSDHCYPIDI